MIRCARHVVLVAVMGVAIWVVLVRLGPHGEMPSAESLRRQPASRLELHATMFRVGRLADTYAAFYPTMIYGLRSLRAGGRGLWWNPFQCCGQPFLGRITSTQLYPPYLVAFLVSPRLALWLVPVMHLIVAGLSAYLLCRELGAGRIAALCGALTFELGNATMETMVWQPHTSGSYVWLPAAMLFCERVLREARAANVIGLAVALALGLLAGFPQTVFYTYQLIVLRVGWELGTRGSRLRLAAPLAIVVALALGPFLAALQELPAAEITRAARADTTLTMRDITPGGLLEWNDFRLALGQRASIFQPLFVVPWMFAVAAPFAGATRRRGLFYVVSGVVYFVLALGPTTPLLGWYLKLPLGTAFRYPHRFMWLTSFCLAVAASLGVDAVLSATASPAWAARAGVVAMVAGLAAFHLLAPDGLRPLEWALAALAIAACVAGRVRPAARSMAGAVVVAAVVVDLVAVPADAWQSLLTSGESVFAYAPTFARLRARMTAQDRVYFGFDLPFASKFGLQAKSASLFEVPSFFDYEPQISRRYAEFFTMLRTGMAMQPNEAFFSTILGSSSMPAGFNRHLLDLAAGRYVLAERTVDSTATVLQPPPRLVEDDGDVRLYENPQALPRARWVPRIEVVADEPALLRRLAAGTDDPREVALVEAPLASGFTGVAGNPGGGRAEFLWDEPEHLVVRVEAPAAGFLVLADQEFPGWAATVNGEPRPIVRANYVFRLVEVPAGESRVEFRYVPGSVRLGAWVSGLTVLALGGALAASLVRRGRRPA